MQRTVHQRTMRSALDIADQHDSCQPYGQKVNLGKRMEASSIPVAMFCQLGNQASPGSEGQC